MAKLILSGEEQLFEARVRDMLRLAEERHLVRFSSFLDERLQQIARSVTNREGGGLLCHYFGGHAEAERVVLGVFPAFTEDADPQFPILPITITHRPQDKLSHRDVLGALMGLSIKRESVGDILIGDRFCVVYVLPTVAPVILGELSKIGRVGVQCKEGAPEELPPSHHFLELGGTVSSLRLDCVVALCTNLSREKSTGLIRSGHVQVNAAEADSISDGVEPGDKLSIRGFGKFQLKAVGSVTKKGRVHLTYLKYN